MKASKILCRTDMIRKIKTHVKNYYNTLNIIESTLIIIIDVLCDAIEYSKKLRFL